MRHRWKMFFKLGITVVVGVAIIIVYIQHTDLEADDPATHQGQKVIKDSTKIHGTKNGADERTLSDENSKLKKEKDKNIKAHSEVPTVKKESGLKAAISSTNVARSDAIHLSLVACGDRMDESLILLKSAVLFTTKHLVFHIFAEERLQKDFKDQIDFWPETFLSRLDYFIYDITFPTGRHAEQWKTLFKPCASQRLFIPVLLTEIDSLLYVDTDILFLRPLEDLWRFFHHFNSTQLVAVTPEHEDAAAGWYNRFARHPYYGKLGVNSGVMLMNLTRLRQSPWLTSMLEYYKEYRLKITWGDQDLINIYFHYYPEQLYVMSCEWNYRPDHCMYMSVCKPAESDGISVLHGNRRVFFSDKQPAFKAVYNAFKDHRLSDDIQYKLLVQIERNFAKSQNSRCGQLPDIFQKQIRLYCTRLRESEREEKLSEDKVLPQHAPR